MCGEHKSRERSTLESPESSPHVRGALEGELVHCAGSGVIPACAGSTRSQSFRARRSRDHPRMCGEHPRSLGAQARTGGITPRMCGEHSTSKLPPMMAQGSFPHVRGALKEGHHDHKSYGIIPACVGSTWHPTLHVPVRRDHPRMCGEHLISAVTVVSVEGSSPHVRGAPVANDPHLIARGIIPACAGSTWWMASCSSASRDHPRMCGEHLLVHEVNVARAGSSPHVRGAPTRGLESRRGGWDHPRMCGEHSICSSTLSERMGSSPHVRGAQRARHPLAL